MRVLLVRLDGIGDAAVCVPLVAALREAGHEVGVALTTRNAGLFAPEAILAEHVLERFPWPAHGSTPESTARANAEIAARRYDVALVASEEPEAYELAAPVPERVGFSTGLTRPLKSVWVRARTTRTVSRSQRIGGEDAHEVEVMYRLGVGLVRDPAPPADPRRLRPILLEQPNADERPQVEFEPERALVQIGPKWSQVGVPLEVQRELFTRILPHARLVALPSELAAVRNAVAIVPEVIGGTRTWVNALADAEVVVTADSGAAHVAGMLGTRVVDVFPDAHFEAQVRRWRPWASPYRAIRASEVDGGPHSHFIETMFGEF